MFQTCWQEIRVLIFNTLIFKIKQKLKFEMIFRIARAEEMRKQTI